MNQIQSNMTWIWENTPRGKHSAETGQFKTSGLLIVSGKMQGHMDLPGWGDMLSGRIQGSKVVSYGESFHPNCIPSITFGIRDMSTWSNIIVSAANITSEQFTLMIGAKNLFGFSRNYDIYWQAMGYK